MRRLWQLLRLACACVAGLGLAMLPFPFLQWHFGFGYSAIIIHVVAALALSAYALLLWHAPNRRVLRLATATATVLLFLDGLLQWEGHAGGYWLASSAESTLDRVVSEQQYFRDSTGRFSPTIPATVAINPRVRNLRMTPTPVGFTVTAEHTQLDAFCSVSVDTTAAAVSRRREWARCRVTGIREEDLLLPVVLLGGGLLLGSWADRRARQGQSFDRSDAAAST